MKRHFYLMAVVALLVNSAFSQVITVSTMTTGLNRPVVITNSGLPGDDRLFVIEKVGRIRIIDRNSGVMNPVSFLNITSRVKSTGNEQGLLGLAFHPDYANNGYFYVHYTNYNGPVGNEVIARYQVSSFADTAMVNSEQILMEVWDPYSNHNGGNLMFGWDGYLYISLGDGGSANDPQNRAQNVDSLLGKILRLDVNNPNPPYYFSPPGNMFYGATAGRDEIYAMGLRNPWRCSIDRMTGDKWIGDVGQNIYEEIDYESRCDSAGHNYGWRCYEGNSPFNTSGCQPQSSYRSPVFVYSHATSGNCSVTGGYVYRGGQEGSLFGKYLFADYCSGIIWATSPNGSGGWNTVQVTQTNALNTNSYTSFGEDIYGELYIARDGASGSISRIRDTACAPTAYINSADTIINCTGSITLSAIYGTGVSYQWYMDSAPIGSSMSFINLFSFNNGSQVNVQVSNANCSATSNTIHIFTDATFMGLDSLYCDTTPPVTLAGIPSGGTFSGPGISGNMFDPAVAGVGVHVITYTLADTVSSCYYQASGCVLVDTQYVTVDICTGIKEPDGIRNVSVYPNPNNAEFNVELTLLQQTNFTMQVSDALGRNIYEKNIEAERGKQNYAVNLSGASQGVYFLFIKTEKASSVYKVIVRK
jgi:glucose/arabinose dehydrogenase